MRRTIALDVVRETAKNAAMAIPALARWRLKRVRTGPETVLDRTALERYVFSGLGTILTHAKDLVGRDVLEFGPGDHLGLGLACLASGARTYTAVDRFPGQYEGDVAQRWYRAVRSAWPGEWPSDLPVDLFPCGTEGRVASMPVSIETIAEAPVNHLYDVVCSVAVGEHVSDIHAFARATAKLLRPQGVAVHVIDFSQHGFTEYGDPTLFLRFPDWLWHLMGSERGLPNRHRVHEYVSAFEAVGLSVAVHDVSRLPSISPHTLAPRFRMMPIESLRVQCATLVCRWPSSH